MIAVPSINPRTMSALRPGRRPALRIESLSSIRFRSARAASAPNATASATARIARSVSTGMPKTSFTAPPTASPPREPRRRPRRTTHGRAPGGTPRSGELLDLLLVEPRTPRRRGGCLALPEREHEHLPLLRQEHVAALVAPLLTQRRQHRPLEERDAVA